MLTRTLEPGTTGSRRAMPLIDIEDPIQLRAYLAATGRVPADEQLEMRPLSGGVSNRTVWLTRPTGEAWVIKQALAKLRVQVDWFSPPERLHVESLALEWLPRFTPDGTIPALIFEDREQHILAMQAIPQPHDNWKSLLLAGKADLNQVQQFGQILGGIHRGSGLRRAELEPLFGDQSFFETLRVEAYYRYAGAQNPPVQDWIESLIAAMERERHTLVHGDYSPKNILVRHGKLILLDHEVMHIGDPAFDIGFSMTHLLSKANHLAAQRSHFGDAAHLYWSTYAHVVDDLPWWHGFETRAVRHVLACLLARIDGRSPLEYLSAEARTRQRMAALALISAPPDCIGALIDGFIAQMGSA
ncbi:MAG: phosphotransferase [bacterium]|nr:phosphotransferase [bacterium]